MENTISHHSLSPINTWIFIRKSTEKYVCYNIKTKNPIAWLKEKLNVDDDGIRKLSSKVPKYPHFDHDESNKVYLSSDYLDFLRSNGRYISNTDWSKAHQQIIIDYE